MVKSVKRTVNRLKFYKRRCFSCVLSCLSVKGLLEKVTSLDYFWFCSFSKAVLIALLWTIERLSLIEAPLPDSQRAETSTKLKEYELYRRQKEIKEQERGARAQNKGWSLQLLYSHANPQIPAFMGIKLWITSTFKMLSSNTNPL